MKRALDAKLVEYGLTATQFIVLAQLWEEDGISLSELGQLLYFDNPTLTGVADRMERDGLLQRRRDDDDRRVVRVYLTAKGKQLQQQIGNLAELTDDEASEELTEAQKKELLSQLNQIWKKMDGKLG